MRTPQHARHSARVARHRQRVRTWVFLGAAMAALGVAVFLAVTPMRAVHPPLATGERSVVMSMAGFDPPTLRLPAGKAVTVRFINPDSPYHTDGGGWHQFRVESLGIDLRVPPQSERTIQIPPLQPGRYEFYCDLCCGGKANPTMHGFLVVTG